MIASHEISEVFYRADRLDQRQLDWLRDRGVMTHALTEPDPVLTARVAFTKTGTFDVVSVDEEGVRALLILCHGVVGEPNDIAAWPPRTGNIGMWLGRAGLIGEDEILQPRLGAPLRIFREPLWWLKSGRRGAIIINARKAADLLSGISLQAEDADHAAELRRLLTRPAPRITWPHKAEVAA